MAKKYYAGTHYHVRVKHRIYNSKSRGHKRTRYSFTENRIPCTSKYMPHQGKREIERRLKKG